MQADREEDRLGAVRGERREHRRRVLRPGAVVEGQHHLAFAQEIVALEMLEAEAGAAGGVDLDHPRDPQRIGIAASRRSCAAGGGAGRPGPRPSRRCSTVGRLRCGTGGYLLARSSTAGPGRSLRRCHGGRGCRTGNGGVSVRECAPNTAAHTTIAARTLIAAETHGRPPSLGRRNPCARQWDRGSTHHAVNSNLKWPIRGGVNKVRILFAQIACCGNRASWEGRRAGPWPRTRRGRPRAPARWRRRRRVR